MSLRLFGRPLRILCLVAALPVLGGCAALDGYPGDPSPPGNLDTLRQAYFPLNTQLEDAYKAALGDPVKRRQLRDEIVYGRMHVYDMEFTLFVRDLSAGNNTFSVGTDFAALALSGLGATTGNAATKAALAAASGGVLAANGAVNKDIFYQKTVPAIIAQMEADRENAEATIVNNLANLNDDQYPLQRAVLDLDRLNDAGNLNSAIATITKSAADQKAVAQHLIDANRTTAYTSDASAQRLENWLYPNTTVGPDGKRMNGAVAAVPDANRVASLRAWMKNNGVDGLPVAVFLSSPNAQIGALRAQATAELSVP